MEEVVEKHAEAEEEQLEITGENIEKKNEVSLLILVYNILLTLFLIK